MQLKIDTGTLTDADREACIGKLAKFIETGSPAEKRFWWSLYADMIKQRTPAQVAKMERDKGLARVRAA